MKFWTIWTTPAMALSERIHRSKDAWALFVAGILPVRVRYWVTLRAIGYATRNSPNVPGSTVDYILSRLEVPKGSYGGISPEAEAAEKAEREAETEALFPLPKMVTPMREYEWPHSSESFRRIPLRSKGSD